jgi:SAM-dependent methyltransferase
MGRGGSGVRLSRQGQILASVDATPALWPVLDALLDGLPSFGSVPTLVVRLLRRVGVEPGARVLDLGCGNAAASIELARAFRARVTAVDAHEPFVRQARRLARDRGVRARWVVGDARTFGVSRAGRVRCAYDVGVMLNLFPVHEAARVLRRHVRPGGVYLVDDAVRGARGPRELPTQAQARETIEALGDTVEQAQVLSADLVRRLSDTLLTRLERNAEVIAAREPRLRRSLRAFLMRQRRANRLLQGPIQPVLFVVRRGASAAPEPQPTR